MPACASGPADEKDGVFVVVLRFTKEPAKKDRVEGRTDRPATLFLDRLSIESKEIVE